MGADTTSSHLIFFIAATIVAVAASGVFSGVVFDLMDQARVKGEHFGTVLTTEITIINDPRSMPNPPYFYVKNTGQSLLNHTAATVLVDGSVVTTTVTLLDGETTWRPGVIANMSYGTSLTAGDHRVRVVTENGIHDELAFRV